MTPRASEGGGPLIVRKPAAGSIKEETTRNAQIQQPTPPSSQSPPETSVLSAMSKADGQNVDETPGHGTSGETVRIDASGERDLKSALNSSTPPTVDTDDLATPTKLSSSTPPSQPSTDPEISTASTFSHLPPDAIPADFLDSALESFNPDGPSPEAAYPSPASTLRPPPTSEGDTTSLIEKLDERISRTKERSSRPAMRLDTSTTTPFSTDGSLPTPTSPALPPRPSSRPPSRPPSVSRRPSDYRTRSPSTASHAASFSSPPAQDPKRLSVSSSINGNGSGLASPRLNDGGGGESFVYPPSPLGPSRRTSSQHLDSNSRISTNLSSAKEEEKEEVEPWEVPVVVRDWAYPESDPRHLGLPHPDLVHSSSDEDGEEDEDERIGGGGGGILGRFRRRRRSRPPHGKKSKRDEREQAEEEERRQGLGLGSPIDGTRSSLLLLNSSGGSRGGLGDGGGPSPSSASGGFSWGFVTSHSTDFPSSSPASSSIGGEEGRGGGGYGFHDADHFGSDGYGGRDESEIEEELGLGEFVPGVYQASYEFIPELETEMKLSVGEWVSVFERQCAGWVQAGRIVDGVLTEEVGLVPENYLHRLDFEEGDGELVEPDKDEEPTVDGKGSQDGHDWKTVNGEGRGEPRREDKEATPTAGDPVE